jgi:hypothetical protein
MRLIELDARPIAETGLEVDLTKVVEKEKSECISEATRKSWWVFGPSPLA